MYMIIDAIYMVRNQQDGYPCLNLHFFLWKYRETSIFLVKLICQWIPDRDGRDITRDIKKNYFYFQNLTKNGNKVGTIYKVGDPSLNFSFFNCPNFVTIFCRVLKMKIIFLNIPSNPPPIAVRNSLTNQFYQKYICVCIFSTTKKGQVFPDPSLHFSFAFFCCCWKYTETSICGVKLIGPWILDGNGRGIARDIKKNIWIFKTWQKMVTKSGQFKKL